MGQMKKLVFSLIVSIVLSFAFVTALLLPSISLASTSASATSYIYGTYGGPYDSKLMNSGDGQAASANVSLTATGPLASTSASASAFAAEGILKASFNNTASNITWGSARGDSYARASWNDLLTIDAGSAMLGKTGYVTATINVTGSYGGTLGSVGAYEGAEHYEGIKILGTGIVGTDPVCGGYNFCSYEDIFSWGPANTHSSIPSVIALNIPVTFGYSTGISYTLDLTGLAYSSSTYGDGTSASAFADYSHTLTWGGITGVFDGSGNALLDFTTTSVSGYNYSAAPLPEPEIYAMMALGLSLMGWIERRRKLKAA